jgi:RNase adaptor protein for sRNA GlmZ degradation
MTPVKIISFGYLHGDAPEAHITIDLRQHFRDPHVSPELRNMTAHDGEVWAAVLATPGIEQLLTATAAAVRAFLNGPSTGPVRVAVGCAGGRHRAAVFATALSRRLGHVPLHHRDLDKPVVDRDAASRPA